jgi:hypothetical protein
LKGVTLLPAKLGQLQNMLPINSPQLSKEHRYMLHSIMENSIRKKNQNGRSCLMTEDKHKSGLMIPKGMRQEQKKISSNHKSAKMGNIYLLHKKFPKRHDNTQSIKSTRNFCTKKKFNDYKCSWRKEDLQKKIRLTEEN